MIWTLRYDGFDPAELTRITDGAHLAFISGMNTLFVVTCAIARVGSIGAFFLVRQSDFVAPPGHED